MSAATAPRFGRMIPAMVTPFDENLDLDLKQARALARRLVENGADALIINGTTGESPTVFYPQKMKLFEAVVSEIDGKCPLSPTWVTTARLTRSISRVMCRSWVWMASCSWSLTTTSLRKKVSISTSRPSQEASIFRASSTTSLVVASST